MKPRSRDLHLDKDAISADPNLPAFLSRPAAAPVYHGFTVVPETWTDGWVYGAITAITDPEGIDYGDGFVVAPDGRRAGLIWEVGEGAFAEIMPPEPDRWGVYAVWFPKMVHNVADLTDCFRFVLPDLRRAHARLFPRGEA